MLDATDKPIEFGGAQFSLNWAPEHKVGHKQQNQRYKIAERNLSPVVAARGLRWPHEVLEESGNILAEQVIAHHAERERDADDGTSKANSLVLTQLGHLLGMVFRNQHGHQN